MYCKKETYALLVFPKVIYYFVQDGGDTGKCISIYVYPRQLPGYSCWDLFRLLQITFRFFYNNLAVLIFPTLLADI